MTILLTYLLLPDLRLRASVLKLLSLRNQANRGTHMIDILD